MHIERADAETLKEGENVTFINWGNLVVKKINRFRNAPLCSVHLFRSSDKSCTFTIIIEVSDLPFPIIQTFFYRSGANIESIDADLNLDNKVCFFAPSLKIKRINLTISID